MLGFICLVWISNLKKKVSACLMWIIIKCLIKFNRIWLTCPQHMTLVFISTLARLLSSVSTDWICIFFLQSLVLKVLTLMVRLHVHCVLQAHLTLERDRLNVLLVQEVPLHTVKEMYFRMLVKVFDLVITHYIHMHVVCHT